MLTCQTPHTATITITPISPEPAKKFDQDKPDYTLLPLSAFEGVIRVLEFGMRKYGRDNWKNNMDPRRYEAAALRHRAAIQDGELVDPESGLLHADHELCNYIFLAWYRRNRVRTDNCQWSNHDDQQNAVGNPDNPPPF